MLTLQQVVQALQNVAPIDVKGWAAIVVPSVITLGGWVWAGNRLVKTVDTYATKQDAHETLDNTRFEGMRGSIERHANQVQAKMDEVMDKWENQRVDYATLQTEVKARLPERRTLER